jgi:MFS family permease
VVAASIAACGLLEAGTSIIIVDIIAFIAGAARSIEFTGINTLAFADIGSTHRSAASSFFSMMQQVGMALGVAVAAILLNIAHGTVSGALTQGDFTIAFSVVALLGLVGATLMMGLKPDDGAAVTGHQPRKAGKHRPRSTGSPAGRSPLSTSATPKPWVR